MSRVVTSGFVEVMRGVTWGSADVLGFVTPEVVDAPRRARPGNVGLSRSASVRGVDASRCGLPGFADSSELASSWFVALGFFDVSGSATPRFEVPGPPTPGFEVSGSATPGFEVPGPPTPGFDVVEPVAFSGLVVGASVAAVPPGSTAWPLGALPACPTSEAARPGPWAGAVTWLGASCTPVASMDVVPIAVPMDVASTGRGLTDLVLTEAASMGGVLTDGVLIEAASTDGVLIEMASTEGVLIASMEVVSMEAASVVKEPVVEVLVEVVSVVKESVSVGESRVVVVPRVGRVTDSRVWPGGFSSVAAGGSGGACRTGSVGCGSGRAGLGPAGLGFGGGGRCVARWGG